MINWIFIGIVLVNVISCGSSQLLQSGTYTIKQTMVQDDWKIDEQGTVFENKVVISKNNDVYNIKNTDISLDINGVEQEKDIVFTQVDGIMDFNCPMLSTYNMLLIPNEEGNKFTGWTENRNDFGNNMKGCNVRTLYIYMTIEGAKE
jgi:hypothetical protein